MIKMECMITWIYVYTQVCRHRNLWKDAKETGSNVVSMGRKNVFPWGTFWFSMKCFTLCVTDLNKQTSNQLHLEVSKSSTTQKKNNVQHGYQAVLGTSKRRCAPAGLAVAPAGFIAPNELQTPCYQHSPWTLFTLLSRLGGWPHEDQSLNFLG